MGNANDGVGDGPSRVCGQQMSRVRRSQHAASSKTLVATSDRGRVKLFRYPCIINGAEFDVQTGHSSGMTNLCFTKDREYVLRASTR